MFKFICFVTQGDAAAAGIAEQLTAKVTQQGDVVRQLKTSGADKVMCRPIYEQREFHKRKTDRLHPRLIKL